MNSVKASPCVIAAVSLLIFAGLTRAVIGNEFTGFGRDEILRVLESHAFGGGAVEVVWQVTREYAPDDTILEEISVEEQRISQLGINEADKVRLTELQTDLIRDDAKGGERVFPVVLKISSSDLAHARYGEFAGNPSDYYFDDGMVFKVKPNGYASIQNNVDGMLGNVGFGSPSLRALNYVRHFDAVTVEDRGDTIVVSGQRDGSNSRFEISFRRQDWAPIKFTAFRSNGRIFESLEVLDQGKYLQYPSVVKHIFYGDENSIIWSEKTVLKSVKSIKVEQIPRFRVSEDMRIYDRTVNPPVVFKGSDLIQAETK